MKAKLDFRAPRERVAILFLHRPAPDMTEPRTTPSTKLSRELGLFDVYAISTGAMFSSGFFLLPGLAAAQTGPSVILAYLVAALFILPAMLSVAELSTAMPRSGGAYYFLDRALGPAAGTVGGLGAWLALVFKSSFALVGMGAYLALVIELPIQTVALVLTALFTLLNVIGAKETAGLQRVLVVALVAILVLFLIDGFRVAAIASGPGLPESQVFFTAGFQGFMGTVGLVFVSYAGLTKVASVAEEIDRPERNIPLGMILALLTAAIIYVAGVYLLVALLEPGQLQASLTPVADAVQGLFAWMPGDWATLIIVISAAAAFASTANAGLMAASRFPMAMARDRLVPSGLARVGRFKTPTRAVLITAAAMAVAILFLEVEALAKLAGAFTLVLFACFNLAVVVMRESGLDGYDPGFRAPFYPWVQLIGVLAPFWLISEMGEAAVLFTLAVVGIALAWFYTYGRPRVIRAGAILHTFARWGEERFDGLESELRDLVRDQDLRPSDGFEQVVARAAVLDLNVAAPMEELYRVVSGLLARRTGGEADDLLRAFEETGDSLTPVAHGVSIPHIRVAGLERPEMVLVRAPGGVGAAARNGRGPGHGGSVRALFFLASPADATGRHLRLMGQIASHAMDPDFMANWLAATNPHSLREALLREEHSAQVQVTADGASSRLQNRRLADVEFPQGTLVALVRRGADGFVPDGHTVFKEGDRLTIIGDPGGVSAVARRYGEPPVEAVGA